MTRDELLAELKISLSTFKRWCKAHDLPINKPEYSDEDLEKLLHCQQAMNSGMKWGEYLQSIGREEPQETLSNGLMNRYSTDINATADKVSDKLVLLLDTAVAAKFAKKLDKPSPVFSKVLAVFSSAVSTSPNYLEADADNLYFLEGEILDDLTEELSEAS